MNDLVVKRSRINGKGVFANRDFKKGELIFYFEGDLYDVKEMPVLLNDQLYDIRNDRYVQVSEAKFIGPFRDNQDPELKLPDNWVNHSCNPNCLINSEPEFRLRLFARRNIKKGEELTFDYSTATILDSWYMKCNCKSSKCRKIVTEFRLLPEKLKKLYIKENGIPTYFFKYISIDMEKV